MKRIIAAVLILLIIAALAIPISLRIFNISLIWNNQVTPPGFAPISLEGRELSGFAADALYMVEMFERVHPIFIVEGMLSEDYEAVRAEFLAYAQEDITLREFAFAAMRYVTVLRDGHMSGFNLFQVRASSYFGDFLDVFWTLEYGRLFLLDEDMERTYVEVIEIGGVALPQVFAAIDLHVFAENEIYREWNHSFYSRHGAILEKAGAKITEDLVEFTLNANGVTDTKDVSINFVQRMEEESLWGTGPDFIIRHELKNDVFFIDLRMFINGDHITETVSYIEQAIDNGIRKFIVDLRGNGGGDSLAGQRLLEAMGITVPSMGSLWPFSELAAQRSSWERTLYTVFSPFARGFRFEASTAAASNPNNVFVSILTDVNTYSSATMMALWVQDGNLGNIIGSPGRNAPSSFGNMLVFELPYSGLPVRVSSTQWLRPDPAADQEVLWPDIMIDPAEALEAALEYLRNLEIR